MLFSNTQVINLDKNANGISSSQGNLIHTSKCTHKHEIWYSGSHIRLKNMPFLACQSNNTKRWSGLYKLHTYTLRELILIRLLANDLICFSILEGQHKATKNCRPSFLICCALLIALLAGGERVAPRINKVMKMQHACIYTHTRTSWELKINVKLVCYYFLWLALYSNYCFALVGHSLFLDPSNAIVFLVY